MEGVEILNQYEVVAETAFNWFWFWVTLGTVPIICIIVGIAEKDGLLLTILTISGVIFGLILGVAFGGISATPSKYETHYEVIITDEVKMTEFNERYEILDQEGKIYTIREKIEE